MEKSESPGEVDMNTTWSPARFIRTFVIRRLILILILSCLASIRISASEEFKLPPVPQEKSTTEQQPSASEPTVSNAAQSDISALTQAVREQMRALEGLRQQNEELARTNQDLVRRIRALEARTGASAQPASDAGVGKTSVTPNGPVAPSPDGVFTDVNPQVASPPMTNGDAAAGANDSPLADVVIESLPVQPGFALPELTIPPFGGSISESSVSAMPVDVPLHEQAASPLFQPLPKSDLGPSSNAASSAPGDFLFGRYDNGFVLVAPRDPKKTPFAAKLNIVTQERYTGFTRQVENWQPRNLREPIEVSNRSTFDVNRAYIGFSGFAIDPRLRYSMIVATTSAVNITYLLGTIGFQFDKAFGLYGGFNKVPGSREWLESFKNTLGVDRSMATTFFRPSMSPGVWITGEPLQDFHYYGMISNAINSLDQFGDRRSTQMAYAGSLWWEPLGAFGPGFADTEFHESPVVRLGGSGLFTRQDREPLLGSLLENPENTVLRLSNGIPIFLPGALAPGVSLLATDDRMLAMDAGLKYRGFSLSGEYYFRWLDNFRTDKPLPGLNRVYDSGGYLQTSFALIPKRVELYAKTSLVAGPFGSGNEYGGGMNWYVRDSRNWRISTEAMQVNRSPAYNVLTPYRIGQSGTIVMLQMVTDF
ncbi:hypothetical protein GC170_18475 [bacterium]|nr:hypothetical protein [bacterium]